MTCTRTRPRLVSTMSLSIAAGLQVIAWLLIAIVSGMTLFVGNRTHNWRWLAAGVAAYMALVFVCIQLLFHIRTLDPTGFGIGPWIPVSGILGFVSVILMVGSFPCTLGKHK